MKTKHFLATCFLLLASCFCFSQIPQGFNYQAVVRNAEGGIMTDTELDIRFTLYRTVFQQADVTDYRETHSTTSNAVGLVNAVIGQGTPDMGPWSDIPWINYSGFSNRRLRVEMDFGLGWLEVSDDLVRSVPYAELANEATALINGAWSPEGNYDTDENSFIGTVDSDPLVFKTSNSERLRMNGDGETIFSVSDDQPGLRIHNSTPDSFESSLQFTTGILDDGARIVFNLFGFGLVNDSGGPVVLQNNQASFTLNTTGSGILEGIGADPEARLVVRDGTDTDIATGNSGFVLLGYTNGANISMDTNEIMARNNGAESELYLNAQGGGVVINSFTTTAHDLYVNGTAAKPGGGDWTATSDARLKQDVQPFTSALDDVMKISPVTYHYIPQTGHDTSVEHVGVIAQDLQKISPSMVSETEMELVDGTKGNYLSVDPSGFTYMLINAVQELKKENDALKEKLARQEELQSEELKSVEARLAQLEQRLLTQPTR